MTLTRREFLSSGLFGVSFMVVGQGTHKMAPVTGALDVSKLSPFVDPLPLLTVAVPAGERSHPKAGALKVPYYRIAAREFWAKVHRDLPPTRMWGYAATYPGPIIEARSGRGLVIEWANELPQAHFLPIDHNLHGAEKGLPDARSVTHVHGAKVGPESDGYPDDWYPPGKSAVYYYPNGQDAAMLWYHDHAMGINRLNILAGLAGVFLIRDDQEDALNLPKGKREVSLVLADRMFREDGQLFYPTSGSEDAPWIPEFFGDAVLVNGVLLPFLEVEPRKYRLRVLNAANSRFFHLSLSSHQDLLQIGTDQGLLPAPVPIKTLTLAPAERGDVVVDFAEHRGEKVTLMNEILPAMEFRVGNEKVSGEDALPSTLRPVAKTLESSAVKTRLLSLDEDRDKVGTTTRMLLNGTPWTAPVTETPTLDSTEIWSFVNLTDDAHPIHLHLVRFQVLDRRRFLVFQYRNTGELRFAGPPIPPSPDEAGWKDTVRVSPGTVTRIIVRFEGFLGRYVWHCHLLEHEDNEMMRPYDVVAPAPR